MKSLIKVFSLSAVLCIPLAATAQRAEIQYYRESGKEGVNQFEAPKGEETPYDEIDVVPFEDVDVRIGGGLALQFQGLSHENAADNLMELGSNFNLPTANLDLDVQLLNGVRMHLRTFLSSRHHNETYVKGGYLQIDELDFISEDFLADLMDHIRIKVGHMEINYGDLHFRRTDNGMALYNPFVGNFLLDSYTTEMGGEIYYFNKGLIAMAGVTNGRLNQSVTNLNTKPAFVGKLGFDRQLSDDFRFRLTGSIYTSANNDRTYLYSGDRAGSRYYQVMREEGANADDFSGRINPGMNTDLTSIMFNPFIKLNGLELFGVVEFVSGRDDVADAAFSGNRNWTHTGAELLYRFGAEEDLYVGARYNVASGQLPGQENDKVSVNRFNIGGGWFMTDNVLAKLEYVSQSYNDYPAGVFDEGKFSGIMLEAVIGF